MADTQLHQLLVNLAESIRDVPAGQEHQTIADRFFALLAHLESKDLIERGQWELTSRRGRR